MATLPGIRIRDNGVFGTITNDPLSSVGITITSEELPELGVVSGNHAILTLDPYREFGEPEIVMVTTHTASSTSATVQRAMYGTTARTHQAGTFWVHAAADADFIDIVTSSTRPVDIYEGQMIYETDNNAFKFWDGSAWATVGAAPNTVFWTGHTFAIQGDIAVPSGDIDFVPPLFIPVATGRTVKLVKARHKINGGTNASVKLQKNGVDITGFTGITVTTTATTTDPADVTLADNDLIALVVTAVSGSPKNLSFTIVLEHS